MAADTGSGGGNLIRRLSSSAACALQTFLVLDGRVGWEGRWREAAGVAKSFQRFQPQLTSRRLSHL